MIPNVALSIQLAAYSVGFIATSDLPRVALQALMEGQDSHSLATLAGSTDRELTAPELEAVFLKGISEAGLAIPSARDAAFTLRDQCARLIVGGVLDPREGARFICVDLYDRVRAQFPVVELVGDSLGIAALVGLFYNHDDVPPSDHAAHSQIDDAIVEECRRLDAESRGSLLGSRTSAREP